jgi:hypothetical protein
VRLDNNQRAFFELLRAGLWADQRSVQEFKSLKVQDSVDWKKVHLLAQEQSVVGLVAAGIDIVQKVQGVQKFKVPQTLLLQWIGEVQVIEQRNKAMNVFVADLIEKLRKYDVYTILVKGQGIAQCYEKPLWRASGDVDLLLSDSNYDKAKKVLIPLATDVETEYTHFKHQGMTINGWEVELHGTQHSRLSKCVDDGIDTTQRELFNGGKVRSVEFKSSSGSKVQVFLPAPDEDVIFVFTHILHHFFFEGIGLRQICDWCRLLWTYRESLNLGLLESRIRKMGLMSEWKTFGVLAVEYLGYPKDSMPLLKSSNIQEFKKFKKKADKICMFVLEVGNFGHKQRRDYSGMSYLKRKLVSVWGRLSDMLRHFYIFPKDSIVFFGGVLRSGLHAAVRGE